MDKPTHITLDIGKSLLKMADSLVETKNIEALDALSRVLPQLILANITDKNLSIIEIQDYINDAISSFEVGKSPAEVRLLTIRKLIEEQLEASA